MPIRILSPPSPLPEFPLSITNSCSQTIAPRIVSFNHSQFSHCQWTLGYTLVFHQLNCGLVKSCCLLMPRAVNQICVANQIFSLCFGREHNMMCCHCKRYRNTNVMHCAISSTVLSHLHSFTFKRAASTPLKKENSLCVGAELRTCHLNCNFQYL